MVRAWYMDKSDADQRLEHHTEPPQFLSVEELLKMTGVEHFKVRFLVILSLYGFYTFIFLH